MSKAETTAYQTANKIMNVVYSKLNDPQWSQAKDGVEEIIDGVISGLRAQFRARPEYDFQLDDAWKELELDAKRYRYLRGRDLETIKFGGVFAGKTPDNLVLNEEDLDRAIDEAMNVKA